MVFIYYFVRMNVSLACPKCSGMEAIGAVAIDFALTGAMYISCNCTYMLPSVHAVSTDTGDIISCIFFLFSRTCVVVALRAAALD
jgi:hypothetical protein